MLLVCVEARKTDSRLYKKKLYNLESAVQVEVIDSDHVDGLITLSLTFTFANGEQVQVIDPRVISQFKSLFGCDYRDCAEGELLS